MKKITRYIVKKTITDWENTKNQTVRSRYGLLGGWVSIFINCILAAIKGFLGVVTGSVSLVADAFHTLSDVATSLIIVISFRLARKPSDEKHPFGHGRIEAIATLIIAVILMVTGVELFKSGINRLLHPKPITASWMIIGAVGATIVIKELLAQFAKELGVMIHSDALKADFWHHRTDAISSILVIIALAGQRLNLPFLDGISGILVAGMIVYTGWEITSNGIDELLGKKPSFKLVKQIKNVIREFPLVLDVHDLVIHRYGEVQIMSFHIEVSEDLSLMNAHTVSDQVEKTINQLFQAYATVHVDPVNMNDPELKQIREFIREYQESKNDIFSFHDLRTVGEIGNKKILMDLAIDSKMKNKEIETLKRDLCARLMKRFPSSQGVVFEVEPLYAS